MIDEGSLLFRQFSHDRLDNILLLSAASDATSNELLQYLGSLSIQTGCWTKARLNLSPQCPLVLWMCCEKSSIDRHAASRMTGNLLHRITVSLANRPRDWKSPCLSMKWLSCGILELAGRQFFLVSSFFSPRKVCCWENLMSNLKGCVLCSKVGVAWRFLALSATRKQKAIVLTKWCQSLKRVFSKSGFSYSSVGWCVKDTATCWDDLGRAGQKCSLCGRNGGPWIHRELTFIWAAVYPLVWSSTGMSEVGTYLHSEASVESRIKIGNCIFFVFYEFCWSTAKQLYCRATWRF